MGGAPRPRAGRRRCRSPISAPSSPAAFFHDAVYDPRRADNEEQSAALAERVLAELGWPDDRRAGPWATSCGPRRGTRPTAIPTARVLLDADLAVLGTEPAAYQAYVTGVRTEYAHVDDDDVARGRARSLQRLLARRAALRHRAGRRWWEARARANMAAELAAR